MPTSVQSFVRSSVIRRLSSEQKNQAASPPTPNAAAVPVRFPNADLIERPTRHLSRNVPAQDPWRCASLTPSDDRKIRTPLPQNDSLAKP